MKLRQYRNPHSVVAIYGGFNELVDIVQSRLSYEYPIKYQDIEVCQCGSGVYVVSVKGYGVFGHLDEPIEKT